MIPRSDGAAMVPRNPRGLFLFLVVWVLILTLSVTIQGSFEETVDHILGKEAGWKRVLMHWGFAVGLVFIFVIVAVTVDFSVLHDQPKKKLKIEPAVTNHSNGRVSGHVHHHTVQMTLRNAAKPACKPSDSTTEGHMPFMF